MCVPRVAGTRGGGFHEAVDEDDQDDAETADYAEDGGYREGSEGHEIQRDEAYCDEDFPVGRAEVWEEGVHAIRE